MRRMLNHLFVTSEDAYLSLDGENVAVRKGEKELGRFPLHTLEGILSFSYAGASPALMGACGRRGICLSFLTPGGRFLARSLGESHGNVLLRQRQYTLAGDEQESCRIARNFIFGKVYNCRWSIERTLRDHALRTDAPKLKQVSQQLAQALPDIAKAEELAALRGLEGEAAVRYFSVLDEMVLQNKKTFYFHGRSKRPPMDAMNALLSFSYTLLAHDCAGALESVGLDAYLGFLHRERAGRASLALDLMEELRAIMADRFVLSLINNRMIAPQQCMRQAGGAVIMDDDARKTVLSAWQTRKKEEITHPYLKEKIPWGMVPHVQALLLARHLRGDLDGYPPFLWK